MQIGRPVVWKWAHAGRGLDAQDPFAGDVSLTAGSGSLEGEGKMMALPQNLGRSCSFMTEGKRLIMWYGTRSFTIPFPFFGAAGALHPPDVVRLCLEDDPFGCVPPQFLLHATDLQESPKKQEPEWRPTLSSWKRHRPTSS